MVCDLWEREKKSHQSIYGPELLLPCSIAVCVCVCVCVLLSIEGMCSLHVCSKARRKCV